VTPKMLARFINAHSAEPALPPLPIISEAPIDMAGANIDTLTGGPQKLDCWSRLD
jgi:hypothetical protein